MSEFSHKQERTRKTVWAVKVIKCASKVKGMAVNPVNQASLWPTQKHKMLNTGANFRPQENS